MSVSAKPGKPDAPVQETAPEDEIAALRRRLKAAEALIAAEVAAREEQEKLAQTMSSVARSEAAEGEARARDAAELRSRLEAEQDEHAATKREFTRQRAELQEIIDAELDKRLAPELDRRLADAQTDRDEDRERERTRLTDALKHEAEQRLAAAETAWREARDYDLAQLAQKLSEEQRQNLAAARTEWEQEHDSAIADRDRHWRERLDREIKETRAAMEKIWARTDDASGDDAVGVGLRGMRNRLNAAANRRRILGYRIAIFTLVLALAAAFFLRYPSLESALTAAEADRAVGADRRQAPVSAGNAGSRADLGTLKPTPGGPPQRNENMETPENRPDTARAAAVARAKALESELSAMRQRLEAQEERANAAEYEATQARTARQQAMTPAKRDRQAQSRVRSKAIDDLEAEVRALRRRLEAAGAAPTFGQATE